MEQGLEIIGRIVRQAWEQHEITDAEMNTATNWLLSHNHDHPHEED